MGKAYSSVDNGMACGDSVATNETSMKWHQPLSATWQHLVASSIFSLSPQEDHLWRVFQQFSGH